MSPPASTPYPHRYFVLDTKTGDRLQTFPGTYQGRRDARRMADELWTPAEPGRFTYGATA